MPRVRRASGPAWWQRDHRAGAALLHRPAGVPAQRGAGRIRGQRGAVADRGPRTARAVALRALGLLDRPPSACSACWRSARCGAVMIAFLMSTIDVVRGRPHPETAALQEAADGSHFAPAGAGDAVSPSGLVVYRFGAPLYFANATLFLDEIEGLLDRRPPLSAGSSWTRRRSSTSTPLARGCCAGDHPAGRAASPSPSAAPIRPSARGWRDTS